MIVGGVLSSIPGDPKLEGSWSLSAGSLRCSRWSFLQNVDCSARCGSCAAGRFARAVALSSAVLVWLGPGVSRLQCDGFQPQFAATTSDDGCPSRSRPPIEPQRKPRAPDSRCVLPRECLVVVRPPSGGSTSRSPCCDCEIARCVFSTFSSFSADELRCFAILVTFTDADLLQVPWRLGQLW